MPTVSRHLLGARWQHQPLRPQSPPRLPQIQCLWEDARTQSGWEPAGPSGQCGPLTSESPAQDAARATQTSVPSPFLPSPLGARGLCSPKTSPVVGGAACVTARVQAQWALQLCFQRCVFKVPRPGS